LSRHPAIKRPAELKINPFSEAFHIPLDPSPAAVDRTLPLLFAQET
jgi:hypothetical protein